MRIIAFIPAHMSSTRLPGKVLMDLAGQTVLERVVRRTQRCKEVDNVVVITSITPIDDPIVGACQRMSVPVFRGSELDVLDRFVEAAFAHEAEICVRITSDCPLIDPEVADHIIQRFRLASPPVDYASNKIPQSYPRGLDTEVFTLEALERAWHQATEPYQRSHVTIYIYEHPEQFKLLSVTSHVDRSNWRWTVDTPEDLDFIQNVYAQLGADGCFTWEEVISLLEREPTLMDINRHIFQKPVREG